MILLNNNLEAHIYNVNRISIRDLIGDLVISDPKWDFIFEFILKDTESFYFLGERLEYSDNNLKPLIDRLSETIIRVDREYNKIFLKIKPANLVVNRRQLSDLWLYYEYPTIIFLGKSGNEDELIRLCNMSVTYEEIVGSIEGIYLLHRNFQPNVLWIEKSFNMPDINQALRGT